MKRSKNKIDRSRLLYLLLFVVSALLLFSPFYFKYNLSNLKSLGLLGIALFNFISSSTIFFPAPGFIVTGIGGKLFNPVLVALFSSSGSSLGESVGFIFGYSSKKITNSERHILDFLARLFHHKYTPFLIVLLAFIPNPFFDALGIAAGAALFPIKKFLAFVFIGRLARDLIVAYVGSTI